MSDDTRRAKTDLRVQLQQLRDGLDPKLRAEAARAAAELLFGSPLVDGKESIMLYASMRSEMDTRWLVAAARDRGMRVALPRVVKSERRMEAVWVAGPEELAPGTMGIMEPRLEIPSADPRDLELVIVPGLGFDRQGYRLGYGAGYYDRFLPEATTALRIGLTYEQCLVDALPREAHDLPVHYILTGSRLLPAANR